MNASKKTALRRLDAARETAERLQRQLTQLSELDLISVKGDEISSEPVSPDNILVALHMVQHVESYLRMATEDTRSLSP